MQKIIVLTGLTKIGLKNFQPLLTATNLVTRIKQVNLCILTLKTWLIILKIMISEISAKKSLNTLNKIKKCRNNKI